MPLLLLKRIIIKALQLKGYSVVKIKHAPKTLPESNKGLCDLIGEYENHTPRSITARDVIDAYGIHVPNKKVAQGRETAFFRVNGIEIRESAFFGYDGVSIPFYEIWSDGFNPDGKFPAVVLFSGHGTMDEVAFFDHSCQKGLGVFLARKGF